MEEQFDRLGLAATRIEAVTPDDLTAAELERWCNRRRGHWLTPLELACASSHLKALRSAVQSGASEALILEDDVLLSSRLPAFLAAFARERPGIDLLHMEASNLPIRRLPGTQPAIEGVELWRSYSLDFGAGAYIVSRRAMQQILASRTFLEKPIDHSIFDPDSVVVRGLVCRHAVPALCLQSLYTGPEGATLGSDLGERHLPGAFERQYFWRRLPYVLRVNFQRHVTSALRRAWFRYIHGAARRRVPFAAD